MLKQKTEMLEKLLEIEKSENIALTQSLAESEKKVEELSGD